MYHVRFISRSKALQQLEQIREEFRSHIETEYEHRAKSCATCEEKGSCCLDAHFVNVRISRLEAAAISIAIESLEPEYRDAVDRRVESTRVVGDKFACPLFQQNVGCLVHDTAKPLACIAHACYENRKDIPPSEFLTAKERLIEELNIKTYGRSQPCLPIPVAISKTI